MNEQQPELRSYRPGDWYAVLGADVAVLLPPAERSRVAALWELVDGGADFDDVLDALVASGLRGLSAFALIGDADGAARIMLRGPARALVAAGDDSAELVGSDANSWLDRTFTGVTAIAVVADAPADQPDGPDGPDLPAGPGLVRAGRLDQPAVGPVGTAPEPAPVPELVPEPEPEPGLAPATEPEVEPEPGLAPATDPDVLAEPEPEPVFAPADDHPTDVVPLPPADLPPPGPPAPIGPPPAWTPDAGADPDHDGHTHQPGYDPDGSARQQPGIPGQPPAPSITRPVARLNVSNGEVIEVDRVVLLGRAPEARRFSPTEQPRLITLPSPHQEISSTHLEIRPGSGADHGSAVVTDLGSTNGTVLVQPGLPPESLQPGIPVQLLPGAVVDLGDGVTIQVTNP
ncbi:FHA domain-containing protein [Nocardioides pantholopis]|uniref:FHA domain-containing protein n=1 Tax=Nocardioides pantholopis TaxID=2483798 RepID=UPI000F07CFCE|nr:FHA domain-containing protein [Nocardioides pantholopis]